MNNLIERIKASHQGALFEGLMRGEWKPDYPSQEAAELALCNILAVWTSGEKEQMDEAYRQSKLYRDKWDEMSGERTYGDTILSRTRPVL